MACTAYDDVLSFVPVSHDESQRNLTFPQRQPKHNLITVGLHYRSKYTGDATPGFVNSVPLGVPCMRVP